MVLCGGTLVAFTAFAAFIRRLGSSFFCFCFFFVFVFVFVFVLFCPFRVFAAVRGLWGGTLVAFTVLVVFYWALGLDICGTFQRL